MIYTKTEKHTKS